MTPASAAGCARCGTILDTHFRFCPECGLPVSGEGVLSTEIAELRRHVEARSRAAQSPGWRRYLLPTLATAMLAFVVGLGLVLFNRPLLIRLFPPPEAAAQVPPVAPSWEPDWRPVPAGTFPYGDPTEERRGRVAYPFKISTYEVSNELWFQFLTVERKRLVEALLWQECFPVNADGWTLDAQGVPRLEDARRSYPITAVSPRAIAEFCAWLTRRLDRPGEQIRIPTQFEWEYAARGAGAEPRTYPWGNDDVLVAPFRTGGDPRPRAGINSAPLPVDAPQLAAEDFSPFGVVAMGTNVREWTVMPDLGPMQEPDKPEVEDSLPATSLSEALQNGLLNVAWRGASAAYDVAAARRVAVVWNYGKSEPSDIKYDVGVRLVKIRLGK